MLTQESDKRVIQYMSQRLSKTQKKWRALQKEALAIYIHTALEKSDSILQNQNSK